MAVPETLPNPEGGSAEDFLPFLRPQDLPNAERVKAEIIGNPRVISTPYGKGIIFDIKLGDQKYALFVKLASRNYSRLFNQYGSDPSKWNGTIELERGNHLKRDYVRIV
jgi:hypothetical protein